MNHLFGSLVLFYEKGGDAYRWQALPILFLIVALMIWIIGLKPNQVTKREI
jgi:hypothetical protein